jgi:flagellar basal body rod protein FlgG
MNVSLYQAAAAMGAHSRWQEVISENLTSSSIPGFKRQDMSFDAVQAGMATLHRGAGQNYVLPNTRSYTSFSQGQLQTTGSETDLGIDGPGFFEVQLSSGDKIYTRNGSFQISAKGELATRQGFRVMGEQGPIQLDPHDRSPLIITEKGDVMQGRNLRGRIKVVDFQNPQQLEKVGDTSFRTISPDVEPQPVTEATTLRQRALEGSNATPMLEMIGLMSSMREFEANQRLIQMNDERMGMAIRDLAGTN